METIGKAEADALLLLTNSREISVSGRLKMLAVGEALIVKSAEWKVKYPPSKIARRIEKKSTLKFRSGRLHGNQGWLLQRIA